MSPLALPDEVKRELHAKLKVWYDKNKNSKLFVDGEMAQIKRLLDYIEVLDKGHVFMPDDKKSLLVDFKSFFTQYDQRRNKNILETFPEIASWYNSIELPKVFPIMELNKHGISNYETGVYEP